MYWLFLRTRPKPEYSGREIKEVKSDECLSSPWITNHFHMLLSLFLSSGYYFSSLCMRMLIITITVGTIYWVLACLSGSTPARSASPRAVTCFYLFLAPSLWNCCHYPSSNEETEVHWFNNLPWSPSLSEVDLEAVPKPFNPRDLYLLICHVFSGKG